jgi:DNA topoisomerase VI subunit A
MHQHHHEDADDCISSTTRDITKNSKLPKNTPSATECNNASMHFSSSRDGMHTTTHRQRWSSTLRPRWTSILHASKCYFVFFQELLLKDTMTGLRELFYFLQIISIKFHSDVQTFSSYKIKAFKSIHQISKKNDFYTIFRRELFYFTQNISIKFHSDVQQFSSYKK